MQYLIVDEILLSRVLVQKKTDQVSHGEYTDEEGVMENGVEPYSDDDTEYNTNKRHPLIM